MGDDVFSTVIKAVNENIIEKTNDNVNFENFQKIDVKVSDNKIAFVDGGQAEILKAVNFSLQLIRVVGLVFKDNKKILKKINEFFVLITADENFEYKTEVFSVKGNKVDNVKMNSFDKTIMNGMERADISKVGGVIRRFAEIGMAKEVIHELSKEDVIVLDGSLKCLVTNEKEKMQELYEKANEKGVIVSGLAKTSKRFLDEKCLLSEIGCAGEDLKYAWQYFVCEEDDYNVYAVKLNKNSKYVFEFSIINREKVIDVLGLLKVNSNDAVFPGYPYGLLLVDRFARISNEEKSSILTKFQVKAGKSWKRVKMALNALNSHEILDNVS